jgi:hypothetical protein
MPVQLSKGGCTVAQRIGDEVGDAAAQLEAPAAAERSCG